MGHMTSRLSQLIVSGKKWNKKLRKTLWKDISAVCGDQELFPSGSDDMFLKGCAYLMADHLQQIMGALKRRLSPKYDEYQVCGVLVSSPSRLPALTTDCPLVLQEDIVPKQFCR